MKIKTRPKLVPRKDMTHRVEIPYDVIVFEILDRCICELACQGYEKKELVLLSDHDIKLSYSHGYYDEVDLIAEFTTLEADSAYNTRVASFEKRLEEYNTWYIDNEPAILQEIERRKRAKVIYDKDKAQREVDTLSAKLAAGQRKLAGYQ